MTKPLGRSDDMMVVKGVNVFPSQIETVLLNQGFQANYQIIVTRDKSHQDKIEVQVEKTPFMAQDQTFDVQQATKKLTAGLKAMLGILADVKLVEPNTIPRSEGKAVRVIDKRNLYKS